ncbi:RNA pol II transcription cofactor [Polyrhizophydium stewartii]|uniref:RNA pol II transcription cofactor n=1 Tax=Polyrhizophydium stewartii TaxID=2732419 RepID=A0ABR4NEX8_9FUNG
MSAIGRAFRQVVKTVLSADRIEGTGARISRSIGTRRHRSHDPFLLLDDFKVSGREGFPDHPHRGLETITLMFEGVVQHEDFAGHVGRIGPGDLQFMNAGRGIVHTEMPVSEHASGLQLWVNLPRRAKMMPPSYHDLRATDIPHAKSVDGRTLVKVISGRSYGVEAKMHTVVPIYYLDVSMQPNATFYQEIPAGYNTMVYTLEGSAAFGSLPPSEPRTTLIFGSDGDHVRATTSEAPARFVLLAGEPIGEPVAQQGLFVMNSKEELLQAIADYEQGRNGFEMAHVWKSDIGNRK